MSVPAVDNEELTAFVSSTLRAIFQGVSEAAEASVKHHPNGYFEFKMPENVKFDVAVSARSSGEKGGGLKVKVFDIGASGELKTVESAETVSRIAFEVPWSFNNTTMQRRVVSRGIV